MFFESVFDRDSQRRARNIISDTSDNIYHGKIVKSDKHKLIQTTAYSLVDLLSDSGGLISGAYTGFTPVAKTFSKLSFELGVISLLFLAKSTRVKGSKDASLDRINTIDFIKNPDKEMNRDSKGRFKKYRYTRAQISTCQFLRLFCNLTSPYSFLKELLFGALKSQEDDFEGGSSEETGELEGGSPTKSDKDASRSDIELSQVPLRSITEETVNTVEVKPKSPTKRKDSVRYKEISQSVLRKTAAID